MQLDQFLGKDVVVGGQQIVFPALCKVDTAPILRKKNGPDRSRSHFKWVVTPLKVAAVQEWFIPANHTENVADCGSAVYGNVGLGIGSHVK